MAIRTVFKISRRKRGFLNYVSECFISFKVFWHEKIKKKVHTIPKLPFWKIKIDSTGKNFDKNLTFEFACKKEIFNWQFRPLLPEKFSKKLKIRVVFFVAIYNILEWKKNSECFRVCDLYVIYMLHIQYMELAYISYVMYVITCWIYDVLYLRYTV